MTAEELFQIQIRKPDQDAAQAVRARLDAIAKPLDGLGAFEEMLVRIGGIRGTDRIDLRKRAVVVMCADNGIVAEGVSQSGQEVSAIVTRFMGRGESSVGKLARAADADVIVTDIGLAGTEEYPGVRSRKVARGTRNFLREPAMTEQEMLAAIGIGMDTVRQAAQEGYGILATGEMGIGNTTTSAAMAAALLGCPPERVTGRGAGLSDESLERKLAVIREGLVRYGYLAEAFAGSGEDTDGKQALRILQQLGGLDIAGLVGAFLGGAVYGIPMVIDGVISSVAALTAERICPGVREYLLASHLGKEPAMTRILGELGLHAVLDAGLALGEGTGAVMLFPLLDMALRLYEESTDFETMQVEQYVRYEV